MQKVAKNYVIQMLGKALSMLIGLVVIAILTRYLSEDDWGAYVTATTLLAFFGVFVDFGLTLTLTQMISTPGADEKKIVGSVMGIRLTSGALFYSLSALVVLFLPYSNTAKAAVAAGAAAFFFMSATASMVGLFQKHLALKRYVLAELISRGFYLLFTFLCVVFGLGLLPILGAMGLANALWFIFVFIAAKPITVIRPQFNWPIWKEAFYRSSPIAISTIFNLIYLRGDVLILAWIKPGDVPQYGTAYKVVDVLTAFPTMLMGLLLPQLALAWGEKNREVFKNILQKAFNVFAMVAIPLFFGTQLVATQLTTLIAGEKYASAGLILKVLIFAIVCVFISTLYGHTIVALHKQKIMTWGYAFTAVVSIIGYIIFIPKFGMWGAAWVTCFSEFLIASLTFITVCKVSKTLPNLVVTAKAIFASLIMYLIIMVLPTLPVLITIVLGALVYGITMISVGGIKTTELKTLLPKNNRL
ncbi:MAG: Polysaccharide biosynthesis protein [Candidatus Uhrbacteria bacterium GW2011_GWE2_45_35]|uniref:Polysaccharide biosynthesis protein n=2 Tax=Candidatus Uhriibacteriota TaxID=1752732 RepID=A0A0G1MAY1_9BACT|nr:MAG: Polysaccharide biosynthesis protein [Candidatus Uhrbacteria bacterium GW2011_GWF2_44_350]KKU06475.1 MAG: Polysaccharide biosynthesis protein [Candidatus Uhrbacteria bacterium GW2011_GWE2_45_35]